MKKTLGARVTKPRIVACVARAQREAPEVAAAAALAGRLGATVWAPCYGRGLEKKMENDGSGRSGRKRFVSWDHLKRNVKPGKSVVLTDLRKLGIWGNGSLPVLLDGAQTVRDMGSRLIKAQANRCSDSLLSFWSMMKSSSFPVLVVYWYFTNYSKLLWSSGHWAGCPLSTWLELRGEFRLATGRVLSIAEVCSGALALSALVGDLAETLELCLSDSFPSLLVTV